MKAAIVTCVLTFWLCFAVKAFADDTAYVIARDFTADGKVLELDVPRELDGVRFYYVFQDPNSELHVALAVAREGTHCYETRHLPDWHGPIKVVAVGLKGLSGRVKEPSLTDNVDMFFEPDRMTPSTVNHVNEHRIAAHSWTIALLLVFAASTAFFRTYGKKAFSVAAVLGFVAASVLMDIRIIIDHAAIVYKTETLHNGMPPLTDAMHFADQAANIIDGQTWSVGSLDVGVNLFKYRLAEHPYAPPGSPITPSISIIAIPTGQVLLHRGSYYLVKKDTP